MSRLAEALMRAFKRDDDTIVYEDKEGRIFIDTNQDLSSIATTVDEEVGMSNNNNNKGEGGGGGGSSLLLEETITLPLPDIRVQNILFMFIGNAVTQIFWLFASGSIFYWNNALPQKTLIVLVSVFTPLFALSYIVMVTLRNTHAQAALCALISWVLSGGFLMGFIALIVHNVSTIQLSLILLLQSSTVMAYARLSPRHISSVNAMAFMAVCTLVAWAIGIFAFVEERDWAGGISILVICLLIVCYHGYQIRVSEGRYDMSWKSIQLSVIQFYGDPITEPLKLCRK